MKRLISITSLALLSILMILLFCGVDCNTNDNNTPPDEPDPCGPQKTKYERWDDEGISSKPLDPSAHFDNVTEGKARYSYSYEAIEDICAQKHIDGMFYVGLNDANSAEIDLEAEVLYGVSYTYPINELEWQTTTVSGLVQKLAKFNFGMKFLYENNPGYAFPIVYILFDDQGSASANESFFRDHVISVNISVQYYEWKDN